MCSERVLGTCATTEEYWYWLTGNHGVTRPVGRIDPDYCMDGDDVGCALMRRDGCCPYTDVKYAAIQRKRRGVELRAVEKRAVPA